MTARARSGRSPQAPEMFPRFASNESWHGQEQVEVDERAGDREEDLLDEVGRERTETCRPG